MSIAQSLLGEWDQEVANTVKMLSAVPEADQHWAPHAKSMKLGQLAAHIAEVPSWASVTVNTSELDFATGYTPPSFGSTAANVAAFEAQAKAARAALAGASDEEFMKSWTLRNGDQVFFTMPKIAVIRSFVFNHLIHHRAQLGVYLRLRDVKVPGMYGPSADEGM
ncbi:MAG: DinB family protein [Gemmatimonadales bacterium]